MSDIKLSVSYTCFHLIFITMLKDRYYHPHFRDKKNEADAK